jgi:phosphoribosylaminoimidazole-succinocarboxamide synthase
MKSDNDILLAGNLPLSPFIMGKVRDSYHLGEQLLIVATDRISAFDVVLPAGIPDKGRVLTQLSAFWFEKTAALIPNHVVEVVSAATDYSPYLPVRSQTVLPEYLYGRAMIVKKAVRLPVECVVRGYLAGSGWAEYRKNGSVCGVALPPGLVQSQQLPQSIFTPTTKADAGHDMPMTMGELSHLIGRKLAEYVRDTSLAIYQLAARYAASRGIIIADTKMEFGMLGDKVILIDELLTPDSSRFWDASRYEAGQPQDSYDKQPLRDWLEASGWNKEPPAPALPPEVVNRISLRYRQVFERLTGCGLS